MQGAPSLLKLYDPLAGLLDLCRRSYFSSNYADRLSRVVRPRDGAAAGVAAVGGGAGRAVGAAAAAAAAAAAVAARAQQAKGATRALASL